MQIVGFLSAGLIFTSSAVNSLVYSPRGDVEASAAGFILLSMVAVRFIYLQSMSRPKIINRITELLTAITNLSSPDRMDLLLWLYPASLPPRLHRLLCPSQRPTEPFDPQFPLTERYWPNRLPRLTSRNDRREQQRCAKPLHLGPAQRLRDLVPRLRLPWWSCRRLCPSFCWEQRNKPSKDTGDRCTAKRRHRE